VTTVLLADDQGLVRAGFHALLDAEPDISVVGEASDGEDAVALARAHRPEVVLMDIRMPGMDGLQATAEIAGASGFLLKDIEPADLIAAVRVVAAGEALLTPRLTPRLIEAFVAASPSAAVGPSGAAAEAVGRLTPREREVLALVGRGKSNAEIAERLVLSPLTAKTHVARLFAKLGARDRAAGRDRLRVRCGRPASGPGLVEGALAGIEARDRVGVPVLCEVLRRAVGLVGGLVHVLLVEQEHARIGRVPVGLVEEIPGLGARRLDERVDGGAHGLLLAGRGDPLGQHYECHRSCTPARSS
jgi:DNA-binding NarL/FixJ family response regulator